MLFRSSGGLPCKNISPMEPKILIFKKKETRKVNFYVRSCNLRKLAHIKKYWGVSVNNQRVSTLPSGTGL